MWLIDFVGLVAGLSLLLIVLFVAAWFFLTTPIGAVLLVFILVTLGLVLLGREARQNRRKL